MYYGTVGMFGLGLQERFSSERLFVCLESVYYTKYDIGVIIMCEAQSITVLE